MLRQNKKAKAPKNSDVYTCLISTENMFQFLRLKIFLIATFCCQNVFSSRL